MPTPFWTRLIIVVAAALWLALALAVDAPVDARWLKPAGFVMAIVVLLMLGFDRYAWSWLPTSMTKRPKLHGTWRATLEFEREEPGTRTTKDCFLVVRQTYSIVSVDMLFDISTSRSCSANVAIADGRCSLWWTYWSAATSLDQDGNAPHRGAAELVVSLGPTVRMEGDYWTERKTRGRITTSGHTRHIYHDFTSAQAGNYA